MHQWKCYNGILEFKYFTNINDYNSRDEIKFYPHYLYYNKQKHKNMLINPTNHGIQWEIYQIINL